jgi:hypothetical protein
LKKQNPLEQFALSLFMVKEITKKYPYLKNSALKYMLQDE